jgi:hypothetical protein
MAIWLAVFGTPCIIAAWLLWRAWWRQAGARLSTLDGPAWLLAAAAATLPDDRRDWGAAMAAELTQVQDSPARWRFAAGCARAAVSRPAATGRWWASPGRLSSRRWWPPRWRRALPCRRVGCSR